jgi:hypothetical protein
MKQKRKRYKNIQISSQEADDLLQRWIEEKPLNLNEEVFVLSKIVRKLVTEDE